MEAQGDAEMRRVDIVYFLSRKGSIEHPHLIRVHHLSRNGVRLRDVKRWLTELRGNEIPGSFSWSYKRRYKTGYVWQDLVDDDLITPISDNEYVIKGSEISSTNIIEEIEKEIGRQQREQPEEEQNKALTKQEIHVSTKSQSEIKQESPSSGLSTSTFTDDSDATKHQKTVVKEAVRSWSFYSTLLSKKRSKNSGQKKKASDGVEEACNSSSSASKMLKNLISCGDVETKDSTVSAAMRKQGCSNELDRAALCPRDAFGGSQRAFGIGNTAWAQQQFGQRVRFEGIEEMLKNKSKSAELLVNI